MAKHKVFKEKVDIINSFTNELESAKSIAKRHNMSRQGVYKVLKAAGVDTAAYQRMDVTCYTCGKEVSKPLSQIRNRLHIFCSDDCYFAFLDAGRSGGPYLQSRYQQRLARTKVAEYFELLDGHVVHHEDSNCFNNNILNLRVFETQGDHVRYHRGFDVRPIWDGRQPYKQKNLEFVMTA